MWWCTGGMSPWYTVQHLLVLRTPHTGHTLSSPRLVACRVAACVKHAGTLRRALTLHVCRRPKGRSSMSTARGHPMRGTPDRRAARPGGHSFSWAAISENAGLWDADGRRPCNMRTVERAVFRSARRGGVLLVQAATASAGPTSWRAVGAALGHIHLLFVVRPNFRTHWKPHLSALSVPRGMPASCAAAASMTPPRSSSGRSGNSA